MQLFDISLSLTDMFRGETVTEIRMAGLDHALLFTAVEGKIYIRSYRYRVNNVFPLLHLFHCRIMLKKSGLPTPRVELDEIGPSLDLVLRRTHLASSDLYKEACKVPKATKVSYRLAQKFLHGKTLAS